MSSAERVEAEMEIGQGNQQQFVKEPGAVDQRMRAIAYSLDALIPGLYIWWGAIKIRLGGSLPEPNYPGMLHSPMGVAIVLPGYQIYSTYRGSYDPR